MTTGRRINEVQSRGIREQIKDAAGERDALRSEIDSQGQRVDIAESNAKRYEDLRAKGLVSEIQLQERRDELLGQRMRLRELERSAVTLHREIDKLSYDLGAGELQGANQRESAQREVAALQLQLTEYQARRTILITAPAEGTATGILGAQGQRTSPQMLLLTILPAKARLEAQLLVPSRAIGFVAVGERVSLHLQSFPYQQFGGRKGHVMEISKTLVSPSEAQSPIGATEATYRVIVALDSEFIHTETHDFPLQPGMLLDADIWLQHRRIIDWLSDPLADAMGATRT
jgi:membrane fusion protein